MTQPGVVTGIGAVCSIGMDIASFEKGLRSGSQGFRYVEDPTCEAGVRMLAPLANFDFDAAIEGRVGLTPQRRAAIRRIGLRQPQPLQATLAACAEAWVTAQLETAPVDRGRIGIIVGGHNLTQRYVFDHLEAYEHELAYVPPSYALQSQDSNVVAAISEAFEIHGEGYTVGASSASGNAAITMAARMVACGAVDVCLAVGPMLQWEPLMYSALENLGVLAEPSGRAEPGEPADGARPFDRRRNGFVPGEAAACLVIESRRTARRRDLAPLVELAAAAQVLDANTMTNPNVLGEAQAMTKALEDAAIAPSRVDYVNAHATATPAGDDAEVAALLRALAPGRPWVNATKGLIGHCLAAAGVIEAVATIIQMTGGFLHPNPGLGIPIASGLRYVGESAQEVEVRCALTNSFGFGGFNSSLVLLRPDVP